jgi:tetratricopeptide (TPR) repeat protein
MPFKLKHLGAIFAFALLVISLALAQTVTTTEAARQVLLAVYQANLTQEAIKAQMDAKLRVQTTAIDALGLQLATLKRQQAANSQADRAKAKEIEVLSNQLAAAQSQVVQMLETDRSYREQIKIFRGEVVDIAKDPERLKALAIYNAGREREAVAILDRLNVARRAARAKKESILAGDEERQTAVLVYAKIGQKGFTLAEAAERYERVLALDPTFMDWYWLSTIYVVLGRLPDAQRAADAAEKAAESPREKLMALEGIGLVAERQGNAPVALAAYQEMLRISRDLAALDNSSAQAKRDLSVSLDSVGGRLAELGNATEALAAFQESLQISRVLAKLDPTSAQAKRDLSVSLDNVGGRLAEIGKATEALAAYQESLQICRDLAALDNTSAQAKRDVSVSHWKLASLANQMKDRTTALEHMRETDKIFAEMEQQGMHISPNDRVAWDQVKSLIQQLSEQP